MGNSLVGSIVRQAQAAGIDPRWALATAQTESGLNPAAVSPAGAQGLFQLMPQTAQSLGVQNPMDAQQNIKGGIALLKQDLRRYGNPDAASAAYFAGPNQANWGPKTRVYVPAVAAHYAKDAKLAQSAPPASSSAPAPSADGSLLDQMLATAQAKMKASPSGASAGAVLVAAPSSDTPSSPLLDNLLAAAQAKVAAQKTVTAKKGGIGANFKAGMEDVLRAPGEALDNALSGTIVGNALTKAGMLQSASADQAMFNRDHANLGNTLPDAVANFAGQAVAAAPILAGGEAAIGAGAEAAGAGLDATGAGSAANVARGLGRFVTGSSGGNILARGASLAAQGAAQGAGFNELTGRNPVAGAEVGAIGGPVIGGVLHAGGALASGVTDSFRPTATKAAAIVQNALASDGVTPAELATVGRNGNTLLSVGGPNVNSLAQKLGNAPGDARGVIGAAHDALVENLPSDLHGAISTALNSDGNVHELAAQIVANRNAAAAPKFEAAFANSVPDPEQAAKLQTLVNLPRGQAAVKTALGNLADEAEQRGEAFNPASLGVSIGKNGNVSIEPGTPVLPFLHAVKMGLDDNIESMRDPVTGKLPATQSARNLGTIRDNFRETLTAAFPQYADALKSYSDPSKVIDAIQLGRKLPSGDAELSAKRIGAMSAEEKQGVQAGVARYFADKFNGPASENATIQRMLRDRNLQARVKAAFPSAESFDQFWTLLKDKGAQAKALGDVVGGSKTARATAAAAHNWANTIVHAGYETAVGSPLRASMMVGRNLLDHARAQGNPELDASVAQLLTNPNREAVTNALLNARSGVVRRAVGAAGATAGRGLRLYAAPAAVQPNALSGP